MSFVRDPSSNAVINNDDAYYRTLKGARETRKRERQLQKDIAELQSEMHDIKEMLRHFLQNRKTDGNACS